MRLLVQIDASRQWAPEDRAILFELAEYCAFSSSLPNAVRL